MARLFLNPVTLSHQVIAKVVNTGDRVIDATVGNGGDTFFLANLVGPQGHVYGFDIQQAALEKTKERLSKANLLPQVTLFHTGHENMLKMVSEPIKGCMFNLGYLPGGEHQVVTLPETTKAALQQAMKLLEPLGIISIVVYTGHHGGLEEAAAVSAMVNSLPQELWDVTTITFSNRKNDPPYLVFIQRR